jgi:hypothetical protein
VPAGEFGLEQQIKVGPMSGRSNCVYWLTSRGRDASERAVDAIFDLAKVSNHVLTDAEIEGALAAV